MGLCAAEAEARLGAAAANWHWQLPLRVRLVTDSDSNPSQRTLEARAGAEAGLPLGVRGSPTQSDSGLLPVPQRPAARRAVAAGGPAPGQGLRLASEPGP